MAINRSSMELTASAVLAASRTSMPVLIQQVRNVLDDTIYF